MHDSYHVTSHISARDCQITGKPELLASELAVLCDDTKEGIIHYRNLFSRGSIIFISSVAGFHPVHVSLLCASVLNVLMLAAILTLFLSTSTEL